jgi:hypothetical protein
MVSRLKSLLRSAASIEARLRCCVLEGRLAAMPALTLFRALLSLKLPLREH